MPKKAVIIFGPPGSGKGTQARKLADSFNLKHFDIGQVIERWVHRPELQKDPLIQRERENFEKGLLCSPEWVAEIEREEIEQAYQAGQGLVFSGAIRTLDEAKEIIPFLEKLYGRENIRAFRLMIRPETSIFRNSHRRICQKCGQSIIYSPENEKLKKCPQCGGKLVRRILDNPETIKVRLEEYREKTEPIYQFLKKRGIKIIDINGEQPVEQIHQEIVRQLSYDSS